MSQKKIEQWEVERYWEIFSSLANGSTHLDGSQAATVLKNSQLRDDQLERVWDLSDVDNDGRLDFEEFCVAMRVVFDLVNGEYADVPATLPDWLVPESKAHLVQANRALKSPETFGRPDLDLDDDDTSGLKDGFDWYISPSQRSQYEEIYSHARDSHGYITFSSLSDLYASLPNVPDTDVRSAWNLINPTADEAIGKDAALAFLHVIRGREERFRLPRTVPPSLRASFEKRDIDYTLNRAQASRDRWATPAGRGDPDTTSSRKAQFGDSYLSRLGGVNSSDRRNPRGTDFGAAGGATTTTGDWEEVRLKRRLRELEDKIAKVENSARHRKAQGRREDSKPALVKRELEQMLEYKRKELSRLESGEGTQNKAGALASVKADIDTIKEQVLGLEGHLKSREEVLEDVKRQIRDQKGR